MSQPLPPFSCTFSPNVPELLRELNCTIALTTHQAGKLIFLSPNGPEQLMQLPRDFDLPMGLAVADRRLALATATEVVVLADASGLAPNYPPNPGKYDALYLPRAVYFTGPVDIHDLHWDQGGDLWAVNTRFSCLSKIDAHYSFRPVWSPSFVRELVPLDYCHLNGLAFRDGRPLYVSMLGASNEEEGWRKNIYKGGLLMDIETNEVILDGLSMPHSPRWIDGALYVLLSARGQLIRLDPGTKQVDVIAQFPSFVRGLANRGDYLFVGLSRIRHRASIFRELQVAGGGETCGIEIVHLPTGRPVGQIRYRNSVEEIYDLQIIPDRLRPGILNHRTETHRSGWNTPDLDYWTAARPQ
ncbi:TIGR03032 family protein [Flavilitoribacter nigricans]|uniref:TIGR03032 family protein n=1 Tax=Flavilitoribacter nigricans (strain ATCC 23147 / DSM 23189 / NBRC 102662 / NCIMB 1420 / SS-2) TaxID=1122177 RepID=A0A2D0N325_FLAN2|nr:TIGR03032 family protein [Flavilitoribacter nigricans]PHN02798.1 TIGR03032 family protein [Flavilitoribacter nigricans DSM 23189 = NBRC 102662]